MAYPKDLLSKDEEIALDLRPHWAKIAPPVLAAIATFILLMIMLFVVDRWSALDWIALVLFLGAAAWLAKDWIIWHNTQFVVTNERVISRIGVVSKKGIEIPLDEISAVTFSQTVMERLIGAGDLGIESSSEGGVQKFSDVRRPNKVQQEIYRMTEVNEQNRFNQMGSAIGAQTAAGPSIPEQIKQLDELRQSGAITEQEFQTSKTDLLNRLRET